MSTKIFTPVSGYARGAASARPLTTAPSRWMTGVGVCPNPLPAGAGIGDAVSRLRFVGSVDLVERAAGSPSVHLITIPSKHDPGSTDLRPPV